MFYSGTYRADDCHHFQSLIALPQDGIAPFLQQV
jgi:hypothetical protein